MKKTTDPRYRWARFAFLSWVSMVGVLIVMAAVKWNQPEFRIPGAGALGTPLIYALLLSFTFFTLTGLQTTATFLVDRWVKGRLTMTGNLIIGAALGAANALGYLAVGRVVPDGMKMNATTIGIFVPVMAVGGLVLSLGMRRRHRD
jgi:hypothetical protein